MFGIPRAALPALLALLLAGCVVPEFEPTPTPTLRPTAFLPSPTPEFYPEEPEF